MKKVAKRPVGRPPGRKAEHRPVLTLRISKELYDRLRESARATNRSMAEELTFRANSHYHLEKTIGDHRELERLRERSLEAALRHAGYTPVSDVTGTIWFSPGMTIPTKRYLAPEVKDAITEAVRDAVASLKGVTE